MKLQIDTEAKEVIIEDGIPLGEIVDWMKQHFNDWKEWEIIPKGESNTWPWYPQQPYDPNPYYIPPVITTDGTDHTTINKCNNKKCHCDGSCKGKKTTSSDWYINGAYGLQNVDNIQSKSQYSLQGYY